MQHSTAYRRYAQCYTEPGLPAPPGIELDWRHVLVIPAYREDRTALNLIRNLPPAAGRVLVILVLNRPDSDPDQLANEPLRSALAGLDERASGLLCLRADTDLFLCDLERLVGPTPSSQGVGLARKYGCDLALKWVAEGAIASQWIHSSDCDAQLPADYFNRLQSLEAAAATYPFVHAASGEESIDIATELYELRLHYYVLGLDFAGSPYAFHTLGSCLAVSTDAYAQVRGFPKRAGGEDFYLLNKVSKVGRVAALDGRGIRLQSRMSERVPFGTGPAVRRIAASGDPGDLPLFYDPDCFLALRALLSAIDIPPSAPLAATLQEHGLPAALAMSTTELLDSMGLPRALAHCRRQSRSPEQYRRQFHQWFDGFRTLKFIHGLRRRNRPDQSLNSILQQRPAFLPATQGDAGMTELLGAIRAYWGWY